MSVDTFLVDLPDYYAKKATNNTTKLLTLPSNLADDGDDTLQTIREWRDIDNAQGTTLDKIGSEVGQIRNGLDDAEYRKWLKVKVLANMSGGEIETINSVCRLLLESRYDGLQEGWTLPVGFPIAADEAMMLITALYDGLRFGIPFEQVEITKTGGVAVHWQLLGKTTLQFDTTSKKHVQEYHLCGTFSAGQGMIL
jgi:hypothetical protein